MAGGPSTVGLAAAVAAAGGLPFLAAGYKTTDEMSAEIEQLRAMTDGFGVNVFAPSTHDIDLAAFRRYASELEHEASAYGLTLDPTPRQDDDSWTQKLSILAARPVPLVSFTFGLPAAEEAAALHSVGSQLIATVTTAAEARAAAAVGMDGLVVQGTAAGGHSGSHDPHLAREEISTAALVELIADAVDLPIIAAGGVDGPDAVRALLDAGASAVSIGTLFLLADEAGTTPIHRAELMNPERTQTVVTTAFTGRPARALRNRFTDLHSAAAPVAYPAIHHLTRALRQAAARAGDAESVHLWAGTGWKSARAMPAAQIVDWLDPTG